MAEFIYQMIKARKAYGDRVILDDVTLSFLPGAKIGVVGPNGMGKSTLLKIMAGLDTVSNGEAYLTPGFTVGILQQEPPLDDTKTVGENIKMAFGPIAEKVARFNQIGEEMANPDADFDALMEEMGKLQNDIDAANGWDLDSQLEQAMDALFTYIRTHSYITEDTRPALTAVPTHTGDKDVSVGSNIVSSTTATIAPETTEAPDEDASDSSSSNGPDWADGTSGSYATATPDPEYTYWSEIIAPTCTEQGYTYYHCNEDSSKDYKSEYVNALGHDFQNGYCTRCGAQDPNAATQEPTQEPTATEAPAPDAPADSGTSGSGDTPDWASENSDSTPEA